MRFAGLALVLTLAACSLPPEAEGDGTAPSPSPAAPVETDERARTIQLYQTGDEATLPIAPLGRRNALTLEFDLLGAVSTRPLKVEVAYTGLDGETNLLPSEYLTGFGEDSIFDGQASGSSQTRFVHYTYSFPNARIDFRLSGAYRIRVSDPESGVLFERPFFVSENGVDVELSLGTVLAGGLAGGDVQPSARLRPRPDLADADPYRFTVCFARNGDLTALRCAPEPSIAELALFGFYLPRDQAFGRPAPMFGFDLGGLQTSDQVLDVDYSATPPRALLDLDYAAFGGDVISPSLFTAPVVESAFRDAGRADFDAEYVETTFRYVTADERPLGARVYVVGGFATGVPGERIQMEWVPEDGRYEATALIKQGRYVYQYQAPGAPEGRIRPSLGQPTVYTALVFYEDLTRFADRLVGTETIVAR